MSASNKDTTNPIILRNTELPIALYVFWSDFDPELNLKPAHYSQKEVLTALKMLEIMKHEAVGYPCLDCQSRWSDFRIIKGSPVSATCKEYCKKYSEYVRKLTRE